MLNFITCPHLSTRLAWLSRILGPLPLSSTLFQVRRIEGCSVDYLAKEKAGMRGSWEGDWTLTKASLVIKPCWQYHSPIYHHNTPIPQYLLPLQVTITSNNHQCNASAQRTLHHYHRPFYNHFNLYFVFLPFRVLVTAKLKKSQNTKKNSKGYKTKILKAGNLSQSRLPLHARALSVGEYQLEKGNRCCFTVNEVLQ